MATPRPSAATGTAGSVPKPRCPAATRVEGATPDRGGIICGVMQNEAEKVDQLTSGRTEGRFMTVRGDPSTIWGFCCGRGLPTVKADDPAHGCFTSCPVWIAEKRRLEERRDLVAPPGRAGGVLAGSSVEVVGGLG